LQSECVAHHWAQLESLVNAHARSLNAEVASCLKRHALPEARKAQEQLEDYAKSLSEFERFSKALHDSCDAVRKQFFS